MEVLESPRSKQPLEHQTEKWILGFSSLGPIRSNLDRPRDRSTSSERWRGSRAGEEAHHVRQQRREQTCIERHRD